MLITSVPRVCTDKVQYDALIRQLPYASTAFDMSLADPYGNHVVDNGILHLDLFGEETRGAQEVATYSERISDLNPVFFQALKGRELNMEISSLSGYDVMIDNYYSELRAPKRNASVESLPKIFPGIIQPRYPAINAGNKTMLKILGIDMSSFCTGFLTSAPL